MRKVLWNAKLSSNDKRQIVLELTVIIISFVNEFLCLDLCSVWTQFIVLFHLFFIDASSKLERSRNNGKHKCDDCYCQYSPNKRMTSPWFKNRFKCPDTLRDAITNNPRKTKNLRKLLILADLFLFVAGFFVLFCF